jgi:hypothetical protein
MIWVTLVSWRSHYGRRDAHNYGSKLSESIQRVRLWVPDKDGPSDIHLHPL